MYLLVNFLIVFFSKIGKLSYCSVAKVWSASLFFPQLDISSCQPFFMSKIIPKLIVLMEFGDIYLHREIKCYNIHVEVASLLSKHCKVKDNIQDILTNFNYWLVPVKLMT